MLRLCSQCDLVRFYGGIHGVTHICSYKCFSIFRMDVNDEIVASRMHKFSFGPSDATLRQCQSYCPLAEISRVTEAQSKAIPWVPFIALWCSRTSSSEHAQNFNVQWNPTWTRPILQTSVSWTCDTWMTVRLSSSLTIWISS